MEEEKQDVNPESSLEGAVASSPEVQEKAAQEVVEQTQETQTPPAEEGVTQEPIEQPAEEQKVPYDRFKEVIDERNYLRELAQRQPTQAPPAQPDPDVGRTPEERAFYQQQREMARQEALKVMAPQIKAAVNRMAQLEIQNFRLVHPEVKPNSDIEGRITQRVNQGYPLEEAYKLETYATRVGQQSVQSAQTQKQRLVAKQKANVVSPQSLSPQTATPPKVSFDEDMRHKMDTEWDGTV